MKQRLLSNLNITKLNTALLLSFVTTYANAADLMLYMDNSPVAKMNLKDAVQSTEIELDRGEYSFFISDKSKSCLNSYGSKDNEKLLFEKKITLDKCSTTGVSLKVRVKGNYLFSFNDKSKEFNVKKQAYKVKSELWEKGTPLTVDVSSVWSDGTKVKDGYSLQSATVKDGKVTLIPDANSNGMLLLEKDKTIAKDKFSWDNAIVYFLLTDRFNNGDKSNDHSFGRRNDYPEDKNIGTWHGGDFKGLIEKLDYIQKLGANAIWITPIVEQIHGFQGQGPNGEYPIYAPHGYWASDFTKIDPNLGNEEDFKKLVDAAHDRGIRVVVDIVMNHVGYLNLGDMQDFGYPQMANIPDLPKIWNDWEPKDGNYNIFQPNPRITDKGWDKWWSPQWVREDYIPGYDSSENGSDTRSCLYWLPDLKTESEEFVTLPKFLQEKKDTKAVNLPNATVLDYLITWQTYWIEHFGIDGFRCDTAKHVEPIVWKKLKAAADISFNKWKQKNPNKKLDDLPFYMVGEVWGHDVKKDYYFDNGFDALINFAFQDKAYQTAQNMSLAEPIYSEYAKKINSDKLFNMLTFISSHDTRLIYEDWSDIELQKRIANSFTMLPGQIQIYYGDESARPNVKTILQDQVTRSDMNWADLSKKEYKALNMHWMKLLNFRKEHKSIAEGTHKQISKYPYAFSRTKDDDTVVIVSGNSKIE